MLYRDRIRTIWACGKCPAYWPEGKLAAIKMQCRVSGGGVEGRGSTAGGKLPTVWLCDLWKPSSTAPARHNMTLPFTSYVLKRNPTTTTNQPIKKLCIIYHVIWQHNQIEYDLQ